MSEKTLTPPNGNIKRFRLNKWRQRYALIEDNKYLSVYVDSAKRKLEDKIEIPNTKLRQTHTEFEVEVKSTQKKYFFQCETESDAQHWTQYLQHIKNSNSKSQLSQTRARKSISDEEKDQFKVASNLYNVVLTPKSQTQKGFKHFSSQSMLVSSSNEHKTNMNEFSKTPTTTNSPSNFPNTANINNKSRQEKIINYSAIATPISPNPTTTTPSFPANNSTLSGNNSHTNTQTEEKVPTIDKIDRALATYYSFFPNAMYFNVDGISKFRSFCDDQFEGDNEEIKSEIENNISSPEDCTLIAFDEDEETGTNLFPLELIIDNKNQNIEIFKVIKYCYTKGKPPHPMLRFEKEDFYYVMEPFNRKGKIKNKKNIDDNKLEKNMFSITMKPKSEFIKQTENGFELNLTKSDDCMIQIKNSNKELRELIGISMHGENNLFKYDFSSLLIDSYHRYCIMKEINNIKNKNNNKGPYIGSILNNMSTNNNNIKKKYILRFEQYIWENEYDTDGILEDIAGLNIESNILQNNNEIDDKIIRKHFYDFINVLPETNNNITETYGQMYWIAQPNNVEKRRKVVSSSPQQLEDAYKVIKEKQDTKGVILVENGKLIKSYLPNRTHKTNQLYDIAKNDYNNILFRFMSSSAFYWSLVSSGKGKKKSDKYTLRFFKNAFQNYSEIICGALTLKNINKINDNIFVYWIYIWTMSKVVKTYMQSGNITIPLQIDLVIIPNSAENSNISMHSNHLSVNNINLFERFKIHDQQFYHSICDPTKILSINQTLEKVLTKCSNENKNEDNDIQNDRIIIIVDRRIRDEYCDNNTSDNYDHIFAYKPPNKYAQIDEEHEILNSIWNTSKFIIPPPTNYKHEELSGAQSNNLFVLSWIIRKKSQFIHLFDKDDLDIDFDEDEDFDNDIESVYSDDSQSHSTRRSLRTKTDITQRKFNTQAAKDFVPMLSKHVELTTFKLVALFEKVAEKTKKSVDIKELRELQNIQTFIMRLLMNRKRDSTVNTYLFYNKGYCRFEPLDLIRMLPSFFNLKLISNYSKMVSNFRKFHNKLWQLDDTIWMEYKRLYLQSQNALFQQMSIETIGTDPKDREEISDYCKWNKIDQLKYKNSRTPSTLQKMDSSKILHLYQMVKMRSQKSLDLFRIIKKEKYKIEISLSIDIRKFLGLSVKDKPNMHGIKIKHIEKNDYGELFKETGVNVKDGHKGWYVNSIDNQSIENGTIRKLDNILDEIMEMKQVPYKVIFIKVRKKDKDKIQRKRTDSLIRPSHAKKSSHGINNMSRMLRNRGGAISMTHQQTIDNNNSHYKTQTMPTLERFQSPKTLHMIQDVINESDVETEEKNMLVYAKRKEPKANIKSCPHCKTTKEQPIHVKSWRMQCHKCRKQWCWQCNQLWNNKKYNDVLYCGNNNCPTAISSVY